MKNCKKTVGSFGSPGSFWTEKSIAPGRPSEIGIIKNYPTEKRMTAIISNLTNMALTMCKNKRVQATSSYSGNKSVKQT